MICRDLLYNILGRKRAQADFRVIPITLVLAVLTLSACTSQGTPLAAPPAPLSTPTVKPNPCAPENLKGTAAALNRFMQRFDDESALAANVPRSQLATHIAALQSIRREAQNESAPDCVSTLKQLQLAHMDTVINTMLSFMSRGDQGAVAQGIGAGRQQHDQYVLELARLLGITAIPVTPPPTRTAGPPAEAGPAATAQSVPLASGFVAVNPGPVPVTLRAVPATAGEMVATLPVGQSAVALGGSSDGQWIQVVVPDHPYQTAWVLASLVQVVLPTPVATP